MPTVSVFLRKSVYEKLRRLAELKGVGWHTLLNELLERALAEEELRLEHRV